MPVLDERIAELVRRLQQGLSAVSTQLPRVLADPRSYPREAMMLAVMVVLLVLMLLFAGYAIYDTVQSRRTRQRMGMRVKRKASLSRWAPVAVVAGSLVLLVALAPLVPVVGRACGVCHAVEPAVASWRTGPHAAVSCYGCHAGRGLTGAVSASFAGVGNLLGVSADSGTRSALFDSGCLSCHGDLRSGMVGTSVRMQHSDVIEAGVGCVTCHQAVAHEAADGSGSLLPVVERSTMSICLTCHDGVAASSECEACHNDRPLDSTSAQVLGVTDLRVHCEGCHMEETEARCIDCHGLELPHPPEFMRKHAGLSYEDPRLCTRCHEGASVTLACECHTEINVHGTYSAWFPAHGPAANASGPGGCNCHRPSFCFRCHDTVPFQ
jgi:protein-S-isoprenylcysteine O-methyltransferase Ste14